MNELAIGIIGALITAAVIACTVFASNKIRTRQRLRAEEEKERLRSHMIDARLDQKLLSEFYSSRLGSDLQLFSVTIQGDAVDVQFATRKDWSFLKIPMTNVRCTLTQNSLPMTLQRAQHHASRDYVAALQAKRDTQKNTNAWDAPIYRLDQLQIDRNGIDARFRIDSFLNHYNSNCLMEIELEEALIQKGLHQPISVIEQEVSLIDTLYRELYEEVFGGKEVDHDSAKLPPRWYIDRCPALKWLDDHRDQCTIEVVSFGFNLVNCNYEFGILLAVHDPAFWRTFKSSVSGGWEGSPFSFPSTIDTSSLKSFMVRDDWVPEAKVTFIQSLMRLSEISPDKVRLPPIFSWMT